MKDRLRTNQELLEENLALKERIKELEQVEARQNMFKDKLNMQRLHFHMNNSPLAVIEFNKDYQIIYWSKQAENLFGWTADEVVGKTIDQLKWVHEKDVQRVAVLRDEMMKSHNTSNIHTNLIYRKDGSIIVCQWYNSALLDEKGELISVYSQVMNITKRKLVEEEREKLIAELKDAMSKIKTLSGLLPICSSCKKIRDDKGYWNQIEQYISEHSKAEFTHGICPECCKKLYPDIYKINE